MILLDEVPKMKLKKKPFYLPLNKDKKHGKAVLLMTPMYDSTVRLLNNPLIIKKHYESYYLERDMMYVINHEGHIDLDATDGLINEYNDILDDINEATLANPFIGNYSNNLKEKNKIRKRKMRKSIHKMNRIGDYERNNVGIENDKKAIGKEVVKDDPDKISDDKSVEEIYVGYSGDMYVEDNNSLIRYNIGDNKNLLYILEADQIYNNQLKKLLYNDRMKQKGELFDIYNMIKQDVDYIKYCYIDINKYKARNMFIDTFYYNEIFLNKNAWKRDKAINLYFDLMDRFLDNPKIEKDYGKIETVLVPVLEWVREDDDLDFTKSINFVSMVLRLLKNKAHNSLLNKWRGINFVFMTSKGYFTCDLGSLEGKSDIAKFRVLLSKLINGDSIQDEGKEDSPGAIKQAITDKIEDDAKIKLYNATGDADKKESSKKELEEKIDQAAELSSSVDGALDKLDDDERVKQILMDLAAEEENKVKLNAARTSRMLKAQDKSMEKVINGRSIRDILSAQKEEVEIPETSIEIDSVNDEWKHMTFMNFEDAYNIDEDIMAIIYSFSEKSDPIAILDVDVQDTSTSEDKKETYTVKMEDAQGKRFTIKFDIPKFVDNKFMLLRGNEKTMNGQLTLIPICKTDEDTVQIVSNYKKIFVHPYGSSVGKSMPSADVLYKYLNKYDGKDIKIVPGDNTKTCHKYDLPIDYIDLAKVYNTIETDKYIIYFNQDAIREKYKVDDKEEGIPLAVEKATGKVRYYRGAADTTCTSAIISLLSQSKNGDKHREGIRDQKIANKYMYSKANILNVKIPLIVIMAHSEGLEESMKKGNINYSIQEKRYKPNMYEDVIKFKDAYIIYRVDYNSSLLMNGLKECPTEEYSIKEMNNKSMYIDFLELYGGRILSDGLDNFYDLMIDPITKEVLEYYKLPTDYCELLAYANFLLADNKYVKHTDMTSRRYRTNELVAGYAYQALSESYGAYKTELKKRGTATMTIKQTAIIDKVMLDPTCADLSSLNDLQNAEAINSATYKGLAGMNYDRSYDLDKRSYDPSMLNLIGMATGFAGNVGLTRQTTMDMNIEGKRGYVKTIDGDTSQLSITKSFCPTEGLTPFGATRDDPFRSAMNFIQTSKHGMRIKNAMPLLISNGTDMALPYLTSNTFSFNAKANGKVIEVTNDYMIVEYKLTKEEKERGLPEKDFIDLRNTIKKNSNGGFYQAIKLDTDLKVGNTFKKNEVIAYDKLSYSSKVGNTGDLSYNLGALCKVAMLTTDEGFEDSAIISEWLSDALASRVVVKKEYVLPKNTNIYYMAKKGQEIQEGDPLMIFQNAFEDDDVNLLLKNLSDDEELISDLGRVPIRSKVTGRIEDIKVYRTVEKDELSESLRKEVNKIEKPINDIKKAMNSSDTYDASKLEPTYVLEKSGKLKNVDEGVLVEFYLSYYDKMSVGDKLIYYSACKGVVKDIFPAGKEPYSLFRPDEKIHTLVPYFGVANRIVCSIMNTIPINKVLIELDRAVKDLCDIPYKYLDEE